MISRIAFITYETPFAPCGGVTAVMNYLPERLESVSGHPTVIITPYHFKIAKTNSLEPYLTHIAEFQIPYRSSQIKVEILEYVQQVRWIFLKAVTNPSGEPLFFAGESHPYDVTPDKTKTASILTRDALFFGVACASALSYLDNKADWAILMQDWEAATTALALRGKSLSRQSGLYLTLHNSYDSGLPAKSLRIFGIDPKSCPGDTVLNRSIPFLNHPIFTVSGQFAQDLTKEILQSRILAPHLASKLESRLHGVNNGPFTKLAIDQDLLDQAKLGNFDPLRAWKNQRRDVASSALMAFQPTEDRPLWGNSERFCSNNLPWFIFAGRDDPRQKGYDVACKAVTSFLEKGGQACFLFFPIPGDEGLAGLDFLRKAASRFPDSVIALPAIFREGFMAALQAAAFGVMPSFYEPFGMANEFYLNGAVAIGRATGGIIQQIVPLRPVPSFRKAVRQRANLWHKASATPTGLLYREPDRFSSMETNWRLINETNYRIDGSFPDRVEQRYRLPLFRAMTKALEECLGDATYLFQTQPEKYYNMLENGISYILNHFSWEQAAQEYRRNLV